MLSHLRFHRRGPSNPSSPLAQDAPNPWDPSADAPADALPAPAVSSTADPRFDPSASVSSMPAYSYSSTHLPSHSALNASQAPVLPPITRVTSADARLSIDLGDFQADFDIPSKFQSTLDRVDPDQSSHQKDAPTSPLPSQSVSPALPRSTAAHVPGTMQGAPAAPPPRARSPFNESTGFMGGLALANYRREQEASMSTGDLPQRGRQTVTSLTSTIDVSPTELQPTISLTNPPHAPYGSAATASRPPLARPLKAASTMAAPQVPQAQSTAPSGKRPAGARIVSDSQLLDKFLPGQDPAKSQEAPKGKKGLPFLKNPVSTLLLRRKTNQNVPELSLPLRTEPEEPLYDPRIRGTRVHDFSEPRRKRQPASVQPPPPSSTETAKPQSQPSSTPLHPGSLRASDVVLAPAPLSAEPRRAALDVAHEPATTLPPRVPPKNQVAPQSSTPSVNHGRQVSFDASTKPEPLTSIAEQPGTDGSHDSGDGNPRRKSSSIQQSLISRNRSQASGRSVYSSLPKHMKSTSSRFSFDLMGAATSEKELEQRHRQKQQDKQEENENELNPRDSRFDDFDGEFDYDALDYDDDLEERIPGVNADLDDDGFGGLEDDGFGGLEDDGFGGSEDDDGLADIRQGGGFGPDEVTRVGGLDVPDPDNDQENFSGFVFQRSDPNSAIATPRSAGMMPTPRDAEGNAIGFAETVTGETPDSLRPTATLTRLPNGPLTLLPSPLSSTPAGLGIQGVGPTDDSLTVLPTIEQEEPVQAPKSLSEDDELYFSNGLGHEFDGEGDGSAFDESIFDLDDTDQYGRPIPGLFANALAKRKEALQTQNHESELTSRTSAVSGPSESTAHTSLSMDARISAPNVVPGQHEPDSAEPLQESGLAAYQAALAAAAHKAAASGKFQRADSPPSTGLTIDPPVTSGSTVVEYESIEDYEEEEQRGESNMEDYELDDDAIIAEANASALANDCDGWYGQEFGFYAAPIPLAPHASHQSISTPDSEANSGQQYGGYFGPGGIDRSMSGRVVSREPNLTPITERSEYSNRNSIMSLALPPGGPGNNGAAIQSPGLAQLALMTDDEDSMSLSALKRLRAKAWGGSQASAQSSREGSPMEQRSDWNSSSSPWTQLQGIDSQFGPALAQHGRTNSSFSVRSHDSTAGAGSSSGSPTMAMQMLSSVGPGTNAGVSPAPLFSSPIMPRPSSICPPVLEDEETDEPQSAITVSSVSTATRSPVSVSSSVLMSPTPTASDSTSAFTASTIAAPQEHAAHQPPALQVRRGNHRHKGSADSISYTREKGDGANGTDNNNAPWVLERRRTGESGEVEILGREVIEHGRI